MKKTQTTIAIVIGILLTTTTASMTMFYTPRPLTVKDVKQQLKNLAPKEEAKLAKTIQVKKEGIMFCNTLIPTTSSDCRVLTARLTVYWARGGSTDADSRRLRSSTGYTLKQGDSIAVDPRIIPYHKEVIIPNVGLVRAVDTGTAVKDKVASHGTMPVIDVFFVNKVDAELFANRYPKIVKVAVLN